MYRVSGCFKEKVIGSLLATPGRIVYRNLVKRLLTIPQGERQQSLSRRIEMLPVSGYESFCICPLLAWAASELRE